jgi:hypothetical protein
MILALIRSLHRAFSRSPRRRASAFQPLERYRRARAGSREAREKRANARVENIINVPVTIRGNQLVVSLMMIKRLRLHSEAIGRSLVREYGIRSGDDIRSDTRNAIRFKGIAKIYRAD